MPFRHTLDPEHREILAAILEDVCGAAGIDPKSPEGQEVTNLILHLYGCGYQTADGLKAMLAAPMDDEDTRRYG